MQIICIMGKTGSGKSTIEKEIEKAGYNRIISYTSRPMRGTEVNGKEYHFITREEFEGIIKKNILMEYTEYSNNYYGAPKPVGSINNVIVVETQGYRRIKEIYGKQVVGVYVKLSEEESNNRLENRADTNVDEMSRRNSVDREIFNNIEDEVDLVIDGRQSPEVSALQILKFAREKKNNVRGNKN